MSKEVTAQSFANTMVMVAKNNCLVNRKASHLERLYAFSTTIAKRVRENHDAPKIVENLIDLAGLTIDRYCQENSLSVWLQQFSHKMLSKIETNDDWSMQYEEV